MKKSLTTLVFLLLTSCVFYVHHDSAYLQEQQLVETQEKDNYLPNPKDYGIIASRATNKMIDETKDLRKTKTPILYIEEIVKETDTLPNGFYYANQAVYDILKNSKAFIITSYKEGSNYILETTISEEIVDTPVLVYKTKLISTTDNSVAKEWTETMTRIKNDDKSYW